MRTMRGANGLALAFLLLMTTALGACARPGQPAPTQGSDPAPAVGQPAELPMGGRPGQRAPNIVGRNVLNNDAIILRSITPGKVVVVNFWATWCAPCKEEMPDIQAFADEMGDNVVVLGVGADMSEAPAKLLQFAEGLGLSFPIVFDDGEAALDYRVGGLPTTVFIDQYGVVQVRHTGPMTAEHIREHYGATLKYAKDPGL